MRESLGLLNDKCWNGETGLSLPFEWYYIFILFHCFSRFLRMTLQLITFQWTSVSGHTCSLGISEEMLVLWEKGYSDFQWLQNCMQENAQFSSQKKTIESTVLHSNVQWLNEWLSGWLLIVKLHRRCHQIHIEMWQWDHCQGRFDKKIKDIHYNHKGQWYEHVWYQNKVMKLLRCLGDEEETTQEKVCWKLLIQGHLKKGSSLKDCRLDLSVVQLFEEWSYSLQQIFA